MTDTIAPAKAISDLQMLAQVEQWLAAIREIDREERTEMRIGQRTARAPARPGHRII